MNKKAEIVLIISGIISILVSIFLVIYYKLIIKNHTGMMDWWAIIMLVIPLVVLCVARIIIEFTPIIVVENNIIKKIIMTITEVLLLPIMLIYLIVALFVPSMGTVNKKTFKKLIDKGFTYKYKNKVYTLKRETIEIQILANLEDYYISFDSGENFVRIEESNLGFQYDRDELKFRLHEYITAPSLYIQRGDVIPPVSYFVDFLNNFIE
mgnify:CR=1 FL=1